MADDRVAEARRIVASHAMTAMLRDSLEEQGDWRWSLYPEVGLHDWESIMDLIGETADMLAPDPEAYKAAYEFLAARADAE